MPPPELNEVETLLCQLFEAPAEEWSQELEQLCTAHPQHATEVRRRFDLLHSTGLDQPTAPDLPPPTLHVPQQLGEFRLRRRLGSGGMGMVFVAEQPSLGREVALKVVRPEFLFSDGARERFRREIESVARLEHPAIVPVLTHGESHGVPYYVMPLVHGCSCDEAIHRFADCDPARLSGSSLQRVITGDGARPSDTAAQDRDGVFAGSYWQACVRLIRQVALGLHHAHRRGIVHRDVKPSNILLTPDGRALVLDFGLAHVRDDARITRTGSAPGSPAYMAPEQMRGQASDERADVYSLAATLHHLLSLHSPFPIEDSEVLRGRILAGRVDPLRNSAVPIELSIVLAAAMDLDRERRHADAQALADDLQAVLEQRPIQARPLPWSLRARRWMQRHPAVATGLGLGALLLVGTPTVVAFSIAGQRDRARAAEVEASRIAYEANIAAVNTALQAGDGAEARRRLDACPAPLRGFEWRHLDLALDGSLRQFVGHTVRVTAVALTDDGERMASGDARGRLLLWTPLRSTEPQHVALPAVDPIVSLGFDDGGRRVVVIQRSAVQAFGAGGENATPVAEEPGKGSETASVVDAATLAVVATRPPTAPGEQLCATQDGKTVLVTRSDFTVDELESSDLSLRRSVRLDPVGGAPLGWIASDGTWLFVPWNDKVQAWRLADGRAETLHGTLTSRVSSIVALGGVAVIATKAGQVFVIHTAPLRASTLGHASTLLDQLALDRSGRFLIAVGSDSAVRSLNMRNGQLLAVVHGAPAVNRAVAIASKRLLVAAGGDGGTLHLSGLLGGRDKQTLLGHSGVVATLATTPTGMLLSGSQEPALRAWEPRAGNPLAATYASSHWINALVVSGGGEECFSTYGGAIVRSRLPSLDRIDEYALEGGGWIRRLHALPDGRLLALVDHGKLVLIDYAKRAVVAEHEVSGEHVHAFAVAPDGRHAFTSTDRTIDRWQIDGEPRKVASMPTVLWATALVCRKDGTTLLTAEGLTAEGPTLRARAVADGSVLWERPFSRAVLCLWLLPDESRLVAGHDDGTVSLWHPDEGRCMVVWHAGIDKIRAVTGDPLGSWIAAASEGETITVFRAAIDADGFAQRLAQADTTTAMHMDRELRQELSVRSDVLAAIARRTDLDTELKDTMERVERLRPETTWEALVATLEHSSVAGQPIADYERALHVATTVLVHNPGYALASLAAGAASLRLGRAGDALRHCDAAIATGDLAIPVYALRAVRIMALAALDRRDEARAGFAELQQAMAVAERLDTDDWRLFHEAARAVAR